MTFQKVILPIFQAHFELKIYLIFLIFQVFQRIFHQYFSKKSWEIYTCQSNRSYLKAVYGRENIILNLIYDQIVLYYRIRKFTMELYRVEVITKRSIKIIGTRLWSIVLKLMGTF